MAKLRYIIALLLLISAGCDINENNPADDITSVRLFHTYIRQENLVELRSNKLIGFSVPVKIFIGDKEYSGTIEAQGAGSRYIPKWSYEIKLEEDKIADLWNFNLSAQVGDPSMLKTILASYSYRQMGFHVFDSEFAFLKINDENQGLYLMIERVEEDFFRRRDIPLFEIINTLFGAKFTYAEEFNIYDSFEKEYNDDDNLLYFGNFINALDTVKPGNIFPYLDKLLDVESYLKYHAVSTVIAASDGFRNNIVFFKRTPDSPYETLPWDFDGAFNAGFTDIYWGDNEIIRKLIQNDSCVSLYMQYYTYFLENIFTENSLFPVIDEAVQKIEKAYNLDPYLGEAGFNIRDEADKLRAFISARRQLLLNNPGSLRRP